VPGAAALQYTLRANLGIFRREYGMAFNGNLVDYSDGVDTFEGYVSLPAGVTGPRPGVLLAHDWAGLHDGMKVIADRVAALGYVCFALDVYGKGVRGNPAGDNSAIMVPVVSNRPLLRRRLLAAFEALGRQPAVDPNRMAIAGYCFGGLCALDLARAAPAGLKAATSFHGLLKPALISPQAPITAKVLVLHGWSDPMAPPADVEAFGEEFTAAGADWQLHAYGHALHAFTVEGVNNPAGGMAYQAAAARRSWASFTAFLTEAFAA